MGHPVYIYRVSIKKGRSHGESMEEVKENKKVLYHFAYFAIVNELSIIKNRHISPAYWLMQARDDEMRLPSNEVAKRAGNCLLQAAMAARAACNAGPPFRSMIVSRLLFITK